MEVINPKILKQKKSVWLVIHVNMDYHYRMERDLKKFNSKLKLKEGSINSYIPTVRILRKQLRGKMTFETTPLLFNYGFIQLPKNIITPDLLNLLRQEVLSVHSYVSDLSNNRIATATNAEINLLSKSIVDNSVYDKADLENLKPGKIITLRGYPFDNIDARVIKVDYEEQKVKVEFLTESLFKTAEVDFDNIIYTIYHGIKDESEFKEVLMEDLKTKYKSNTRKYE